jgi:ATP-dependent transcriptional regulator
LKNAYITAKIIEPALPPKILHRAVLVKRLSEIIAEASDTSSSHYKLVLLCAPPGYGKTTLLVDFAKHTNIICCWYLLDRTDADKITFLETLLASIRYRFPTFGKALDSLLLGARPIDNNHPVESQYFEAVIDALVLAITTEITERFAILLCNYHELNSNQTINALVNQLLQKLPPHCILIIESRTVPDLDFAPLLIPPRTSSLNSNVLRFTTQEIRDLAHLQGVAPLSDVEIEQLATLFDGWIAGILLGICLEDIGFLYNRLDFHISKESPAVYVNQQKLFSHLVNETFKREPDVYDILKDTAVLQQIPPSLCGIFLGLTVTEASARFRRLEQQGLFVTHSGDDSQVIYTCHPVLRDFLCEELRSQSPARFKALHRRAAELWHNSQDYDQAIYHAFEASAYDLAADLIIEIHEQMFVQGRTETLARWIDELPEQTTANRLKLLLIRIKVHLMIGEHTHAYLLLDKVSTILTHQPLTIKNISLLQAESYLLRSKVLFLGG